MKHKHPCQSVVAGKSTAMHKHCGHLYGEHQRFFPQPVPVFVPEPVVSRAQLERWAGALSRARDAAVALTGDLDSPYARAMAEIEAVLNPAMAAA